MRIWDAFDRLQIGLPLIGFGIAYVVIGHTAGKIVGAALISFGVLAWAPRRWRRRVRRRQGQA